MTLEAIEAAVARFHDAADGEGTFVVASAARVLVERIEKALAERNVEHCGVCGEAMSEGTQTVSDVEVGRSHAFHYDDE